MFKTLVIFGLFMGLIYAFTDSNGYTGNDHIVSSDNSELMHLYPSNKDENRVDRVNDRPGDIFEECGNRYRLNDEQKTLLHGLVHQESVFNPNARNRKTGATGLAQYLPRVAASKGLDPYDPNASICQAAKDFKDRKRKGYSNEQAVMAHFGGDSTRLWKRKTLNYCYDVFGKSRMNPSNCENEFYAMKAEKSGNQYAYN